jgi:hypothetical protein
VAVIEAPVNTPEAWSVRAATIDDPWTACGWSREGQQDRHEAIIAALAPVEGDRLLDYGCGTGELCTLVPTGVGYLGYDSAAGMIRRAHADHATLGRRFTTYWPHGESECVACVGPFNLAGGWSKERTWHTLRHLWDTTRCRALAVSLYAGDDEHCLRYEEREARRCGYSLGFDVTVERFLPNDLLMVARR